MSERTDPRAEGGSAALGGPCPGGEGGVPDGEAERLRAELDNLADIHRAICSMLARVTAERDRARADLEAARREFDELLAEMTEAD